MAGAKFITFEGGEGAGKSTQIALLAEALSAAGIPVQTTREPGGSPGAEQIRELLVTGAADRWDATTEALLHFAARREHLRSVVLPGLAAGYWVLSDRFADSTMAYQGYGHELGRAPIEQLYDLVVGDFAPDLTLILDIPVELGLERARARRDGEDRYEGLDREFHERLHQGFREIAEREPGRCELIDASGEVTTVQAAVRVCVAERLGVHLGVHLGGALP
jgi:dTMP kinase